MNYAALLQQTGDYIRKFTTDNDNPKLYYHNLEHTEQVVAAAKQIGNHYQLHEADFFTVVAAAWFHDIGYYTGTTNGHEQRAADLAGEFLKSIGVDEQTTATVKQCILATQMPQQPVTDLDKIVCDADFFHLGSETFSERNKLMREEVEAVYQKEINKADWRRNTIKLLQQHHYHTDYCRLLLEETKQENIARMLKKDSTIKVVKPAKTPAVTAITAIPAIEPVKKEKENPGRGIETMFRITSGNNQRLSDMADNKAHILITVNSIILSAIISLVLRKLDESSFLTYPTFILLTISLVTIVVCILATRPSIPHGEFTKQDVTDKKVNLLFFGNFYKMNLEDYTAGMQSVMSDKEFLYGTLIKDVYSQGVVLGRKYRLLRLAYNIFMFGLSASVIGFIIVFFIYR